MTSNRKVKHSIRSDFADIVIKVDEDLYYLDRLQLASKSDYFEILFTEDFQEKKHDLIELPIMDSATFSAIVDVIYDKSLWKVLTRENFVSLLIAMDYLQMEINLKDYVEYIKNEVSYNKAIFKLYNFVLGNQNFESLLPTVLVYFSSHLKNIRGCEEFLSLPIEHFIEIISSERHCYNIEHLREFCQICIEWIWHDVENRFPHTLKIVNAAKCGLSFPYGTNDNNLLINLRSISREKNREKFAEYFQRLLFYKGEINPVGPTSMNDKKKQIKSIRFSENGERDRLVKYLKNGDFSDVTIKVEGKTYKLHRVKLSSTSDYFKDLFSAERSAETSVQPEETLGKLIQRNESKEYLLDEIDQATFEAIVKYIYFNAALEITSDNIVRLLKAAFILKIQELMCGCESWMENNVEKISSEMVVEILNLTRGNDRVRNFFKFYFRKRVTVDWPEIGNDMMFFRSFTFDMLEELLFTNTHFSYSSKSTPDFCMDDHNKLLDICSKWVIHDVENRYHLIPRIAFFINGNGTVDHDDYKMKTPADFNTCSPKFVRDKLWEILGSTSLAPSNASLRNRKRIEKEPAPAFVSLLFKNEMNILNGDLDPIASLSYSKEVEDYMSYNKTLVSATMIDDNVFILAESDVHFNPILFFQVYNISLKKFISLSGFRIRTIYDKYCLTYKLLNCCNEVYCCIENGCVLKYSIELNRWFKISMLGVEKDVKFVFASDGKKLYKMYKNKKSSQYVVDFYDFEQNVWISLSNLSFRMDNYSKTLLIDLTFVNGGELCALFNSKMCLYNKTSQVWRQFELPDHYFSRKPRFVITQCVNEILLVTEDAQYRFSESNQNGDYWEYKKLLPSKLYDVIYAIHRPDVCTA